MDFFYNQDCIQGCREHILNDSVDLIITDPPYGIGGDELHKHYNRKEEFVIDGYIEIPIDEYPQFSREWISEAHRILRPGGSIYIVSGYTNLIHILNALRETSLTEVNHIVWRYNFGVYTKNKYVSSHYHILFYTKPGGSVTFNTFCRYGQDERIDGDKSLNYQDREDVWIINREYKPGKVKNKNELPTDLLIKMIQYSSNEHDLVFDLFLGSFSTAKIAIGMNRRVGGFEVSPKAFSHQIKVMKEIIPGSLLPNLRLPTNRTMLNQGKSWTDDERRLLWDRYSQLVTETKTKKRAIEILCDEYGRGRFSILKVLERF